MKFAAKTLTVRHVTIQHGTAVGWIKEQLPPPQSEVLDYREFGLGLAEFVFGWRTDSKIMCTSDRDNLEDPDVQIMRHGRGRTQ